MLFERLFKASEMAQAETDSRADQLLEAAYRVLVEKGWASGSVRDIARQAGVAPGLLYHYFGSKQGLLAAVLERYNVVPELVAFLDARAGRPATEVLPALVHESRRLFDARGGMIPVVVREAQVDPALHERWLALMAEGQAAISHYLDSRVKAGELRPHNTAVATRMLMSTVMVGRLTGTLDLVADDLPELLLHGILETDR